MKIGYDWGEEDLIKHHIDDGWKYFVQFNDDRAIYDYNDRRRREEIWQWLKNQGIEFQWVGGRFNYELVFKHEEDACFFKLHYGI